MEYSFTRYLAAKKTVDDRSLNQGVWRDLLDVLQPWPLHILEVGAGTGTMVERLADWGLRWRKYTAIDADAENIEETRRRLEALELPGPVELAVEDVHAFAAREKGRRQWDLVIAHAFLDLIDITRILPELFGLLRLGGWFYFTINFDGLTAFEPVIDPAFDEQIIEQYHRTMDERETDGQPSAGSRAGRSLLAQIPAAGGEIVAAGSSDWVVLPRSGRYPADEAYFLHHILHFFETSLTGRAEIDPARLAAWLDRRHAQIDAGELIYIAHQIDVCGYLLE